MKALYIILVSSILLSLTYINPSKYVVQVAAYGKKVNLAYFADSGLEGIYMQYDQNRIYRYYLGEYDTKEKAIEALELAHNKGFKYARIVDLNKQRELCGSPCPQMTAETTFAELAEENTFLKTIYFDFDKHILRWKSMQVLDTITNILRQDTSYKVHITGHTDNIGNADYNVTLSQHRARTARNYLVNKGIHAYRIYADVYGESKPRTKNPLDLQLNRRVVIAILTNTGELISKVGTGTGTSVSDTLDTSRH